ncbi:MAG: Rne/Rng family ribonuclease [Nitrospirae bacterium]|nr:Rne/Rng family ribonuclease [Nitrospirota bacterium]
MNENEPEKPVESRPEPAGEPTERPREQQPRQRHDRHPRQRGGGGGGGGDARTQSQNRSSFAERGGGGGGWPRHRSGPPPRPREEEEPEEFERRPAQPIKIVISAAAYETRAGVLEGDKLAEILIERPKEKNFTGNIYRGKIVRLLPGMQSAFVDINDTRTAFLHITDVMERWEERNRPKRLEQVFREGDSILSQIIRDPVKDKGAKLSTKLTYTGRFCVVVIGNTMFGISRRIEDKRIRRRLHDIGARMQKRRTGLIFRTAAGLADEEAVVHEIEELYRAAEEIADKFNEKRDPELLSAEPPLIIRAARDMLGGRDEELIIDREEAYQQVVDYMKRHDPGALPCVKLYKGHEHVFEHYGIEAQIQKALQKEIDLPSGGSIVIDETEALTAIDVNTGHYVGRGNVEQTLLKTNLEAAQEIAYQIKLRNIGGLIVLDFIDMAREENERRVYDAMLDEFRYEKGRTIIQRFSGLGVIEMARFQTRKSLRGVITEPCVSCNATGQVKKSITICYEILRMLEKKLRENKKTTFTVTAHTDIAYRLDSEEKQYVDRLREKFKAMIEVRTESRFRPDEFWVD